MVWGILASLITFAGFGIGQYIQTVDELMVLTVLIGISYGAVWTIIPILTGEFFGYVNFAKNWGLMTVLPAFGGQAFGIIYGLDSGSDGNDVCRGTQCFQTSFLTAAIASLIVLIVNVILLIRRK